ncbi:MAG: galactitol-1-phosphate 5-dehydrogenase [Prolixibacteraceae bacterium]|jgi:2-desacetyl-2-hydroxyethyl bacteriochlorophyllide A dehydrogenase|nr:galactitol-1-phosphate 5-dehydrogenase [Prolixibacteraceae bacterium]MBT6005399.1 galactitol-1-phosphate 5-dehydrogenase [Prolixibacteraceae bacterium]MBT6766097.1 galactitol-1-phosphate 5-dehydrogenase [Prolixibacteraceae bacterium]MBT6996851.1 galactitol-1-phosphate 5-dehydrogenase [Prolixibacteraceae bacterium]MBT7395266.1 galactitol-1-phosphate 5-dehydrogenase [Prolixibacteraceae bacterium]
MKALVLDEYNELNYRDFPKPKIEPHEVLVKVKACGICGSDVHGMDGSTGRRKTPLIMGHEASGEIAEIGSEVQGWQIGDRVTFDSTIYYLDDWYTRKGRYNLSDNRKVLGVSPMEYKKHGAFAEYVSMPAHILYKLPVDVSFEQAAMVEPVAVAAHAVNVSKIQPGKSAVVIGVGMVGVFVVKMLQIAGANPIIAVDLDENKLELAKEFGATHTFKSSEKGVSEKVFELTKNRGADFGFEVVGISETVNLCINSLRKGGTAILVGNLKPEVTIPLQKVVTTELSLLGSCAINGEYELVLDLMSSGKISVDKMISAVAPLSEGADWFNRLYNKESGLNKVILVP